jgi:hypothetical protein
MQPRYRNVICPWMTDKDIKHAVKFVDEMIAGMMKRGVLVTEIDEMLNLHKLDRVWRAKG